LTLRLRGKGECKAMGEALDKEAYLRRLNEKLRKQSGFEEGMAFLDLDAKGYHLCDPRQA